MIGIIKSNAFVLRKKELLGKDIAITLFTEHVGKIRALVKGVKSIKSRRQPNIQTGNYVQVILRKKHDLLYLEQAHLYSLFSGIKKNHLKTKQMYFFLYLLDALLPENQKEVAIYNLTLQYLSQLSKITLDQDKMINYCNHLLRFLGYDASKTVYADIVDELEKIMGKKIPYFII